MRLRRVTLQNFRNITLARLELKGTRHFITGSNGQGKTNILEGISLLTALRSFRTADFGALIQQDHKEAGLGFELEHERYGGSSIQMLLRSDGRELTVDQQKITRLGDFVGQYPCVVFSSHDLLLLRGAPARRRRWLDLSLAVVDREYLRQLQTYHQGLAGRNALLKKGSGSAQLFAFDQAMASAAVDLFRKRAAGMQAFAGLLVRAYNAVAASSGEQASLAYRPNCPEDSAEAFCRAMRKSLEADLKWRSTQRGPHKDDFEFSLNGQDAKIFASEGQQRLFVLAIKMAQASWFLERGGLRPVLLLDDVVGDLDLPRRERFWSMLADDSQIIATGTSLPEAFSKHWQVLKVEQGVVSS
jgi:DNA replication and repair protein RecF